MLEAVTLAVVGVTVVVMLLLVRGGLAIAAGIVAARRRPPDDPAAWPFVALIVPCKGAEAGLAENLARHLRHDYPAYEVLFVVADADDPAIPVIEQLRAAHPTLPIKLVVAPRLPDCVEKTSNQLAALKEIDPRCEVLAFADSDGEPLNAGWLKELVRPTLAGNVATGYRWYLPEDNVARLQGTWDSAWCGFHIAFHTVWGGAMAVRKDVFDRLNMADHWSRAPTDDVVLAREAWKAGVPVVFAPGAMCLSGPHKRLASFLTWIRRQTLLVRLPAFGLYAAGLFVASLYFLSYALCVALLIVPGPEYGLALPLAGLGGLLGASLLRAWVRYRLARALLPGREADVARTLWWPYAVFVVVADLLMFPIYASVLFARTIRWRGVTYVWTGDRVRRVTAEPWREETSA